jgi:transcriptional regulator with GAF, ATPase, and Fis domain
LLRVIQEGELEKIGRSEPVKVNVRVLAATNKDLEKEVDAKRFREDLYYRLNVIPIWVPSLQDRADDIPLLAEHFLLHFSKEMGRQKPILEPEATKILQSAPWKGNVRELMNVIRRLLFMDEPVISPTLVRRGMGIGDEASASPAGIVNLSAMSGSLELRELERLVRIQYINYTRMNSTSDAEAAKKLGLAPSNFHRICKELGIK